ncbi:MAG: glucosaminidase domain-containing protein [Hyphomicrobium sp.]|nr:glucosaminidase domain-containing protein [Hyphomicrobium sp.]
MLSFRASVGVLATLLLLPGTGVAAESLPPIKTSSSNVVPECVTPGRLMAFIKDRNPQLSPELQKIAVEYMRHGEALGVRWDYAFFQMVIETGYLTFEREKGRRGDVRAKQNNFAGLGATGRGVSGEAFPDVSTGVLAHLQHVLMYTGEAIDAPVAERTQKVIEWKVLDTWRDGIKGPMTYAHLAEKWANNKAYGSMIAKHAEIFAEHFCNTPDPAPELLAEARPQQEKAPARTVAAQTEEPAPAAQRSSTRPTVSGRELAQRAIEEARASGDTRRSSLGGAGLGALATEGEAPVAAAPAIETASLGAGARVNPQPPPTSAQQNEPTSPLSPLIQAASTVGSMLRSMTQPPPAPPAPPAVAPVAPVAPVAKATCRVWTASYGGAKAILIKAPTPEGVSYTVLDVNEGAEKREAAAYIAAYAKGGHIESTFTSQIQALEKAFELCPEG